MTRTTQDTFYETTIPSGTVGESPSTVLANQMSTWLADFKSNGVAAWTEEETGQTGLLQNWNALSHWDMVDGRIYRTKGDRTIGPSGAGDTSGVCVIDPFSATNIRFQAGHDYGTNGSNRQLATSQQGAISITVTTNTEMYVAMSINEYELILIVNQNSTWSMFFAIIPLRLHIPSGLSGVAKTTSVITGTGSNQVIPLDRDISANIAVGQNVWIVPQTASGDAFETPTVEIETVVAVDATSITLAPSNNYAAGALIGLDPVTIFISNAINPSQALGSIGETADISLNANYLFAVMTTGGETQVDPSTLGFYRGYRIEFWNASSVASYRGTSSLLSVWSSDASTPQTRASGDFNRDQFDATRKFAPYPNFNGVGAYEWNLGPFETAKT